MALMTDYSGNVLYILTIFFGASASTLAVSTKALIALVIFFKHPAQLVFGTKNVT